MLRINSQTVFEEQLVPRANRLVIKKNNQCVALDSHIKDTMLRFKFGYNEDPDIKLIAIYKMVATRLRQPWRAILSVLNRRLTNFASLIWDEFEWKTIERSSRHTRFTKLIIDYILSHNKSIPRRSDSKLHSSQDDQPITKLLNMTNGDYKFGMEVPDAIISDAIRKKEGYTYYMAKKVEIANVTDKLKKDVVPGKTRSLTIAEETVVVQINYDANDLIWILSDDNYSEMMMLQDPLNNREGENKKKRRKDVGEPSSRSSRRNRSPIVIVQDGTPSMQPLDKTYILIQKHSNPKWFLKMSGLAKRRTTWFDLFLKSDIDKDENHILGPSIVAIAKKLKELIQKDELTIADLRAQRYRRLRCCLKLDHLNNTIVESTKTTSLFYYQRLHLPCGSQPEEKYTTSITKHYAARYHKEGIEDMIPKEVYHYHFKALNVRRSNDKEYEFSYAYLPRLSMNDVEDMYLLQLSEVKKFCDGTLVNIQENLIDMLSKNKLGSGNKKLRGRD
ncbi:hypothetical protein Tco_0538237 [Tanacetum coccineum]